MSETSVEFVNDDDLYPEVVISETEPTFGDYLGDNCEPDPE